MKQRQSRKNGGQWQNEEPLTDIYALLEILGDSSPTTTPIHLAECTDKEDGDWEVVAPWYRDGDSGGDRSGHNYYQVDSSAVETLLTEGFVKPRTEKGWGYTHTIRDEHVISTAGHIALAEHIISLRAEAEALLAPGVHTDLTGKILYRGYFWEHQHSGKLFFTFEMPGGKYCQVDPKNKTIKLPEHESAA